MRELQNPRPDDINHYHSQKTLFDRIQGFIRNVLNDQTATCEIPGTSDDITIKLNNGTCIHSIENVGTGIHEIIIFAIRVTLLENTLICIDEPEIHLHPIMQKRLLKFLKDNARTNKNQYFITTHSNSFIDEPGINIYRCQTDSDGDTSCTLTTDLRSKKNIIDDLGYKASDLLQTNCIIWVEGPSDRIYLKHWLSFFSDLKEGMHFSIMFYGGRLLSHLDFDQNNEAAMQFIELAHLNKHAAILIDSDCKNPEDTINSTKQRIKKSFGENAGFCWITEGRTIENYLDGNTLNQIDSRIPSDKWTKYSKLEEFIKSPQKIAIAQKAITLCDKLEKIDKQPQEQIKRLVSFINKCNGIDP